jgi:hypothetical protein
MLLFLLKKIKTDKQLIAQDTLKSSNIDPLTPAKAAFIRQFYQVWGKHTIKILENTTLCTVP